MKMKRMPFFREAFAVVSLGLLCGWYYILMGAYPILVVLVIAGSRIVALTSGALLATLIMLTFSPLRYKSWEGLLTSWVFEVWKEYFEFEADWSTLTQHYSDDHKYLFMDFPHGIFPLGQLLSASLIEQLTPGKSISGTAADIVFRVPGMRQFMSLVGSVPATRKRMKAIWQEGGNVMVIPGGIAEMFLISESSEGIFLKKRLNTVRLAIEEGAHIVPVMFFGNTRTFRTAFSVGSWAYRLSRALKMSFVLFYGRWGLPVPLRHPICMVTGAIVEVQQKAAPSEAEVQRILDAVIASLTELYETHKPDWETRPLIIS